MDTASKQKGYPHLEEAEKMELIKKDIEIKLFKDQIAELELEQMRKLQKGPLLAIKDDQKVKEFV